MPRQTDMVGAVALVTGAGRGLGRAIARDFGARGASVVVIEVDPSSGDETARKLRESGVDARYVHCDVASEASISESIEETVRVFGRLDYAINNAAIICDEMPLADHSAENFRRVLAVNLEGVFLCLKYQLPVMERQGGGSIVNISSISGLRAHKGLAPYVAAKHGINGLTKVAAIEYGLRGIRINSLCPGGILTPELVRYFDETPAMRASIIDANPLGRLSEPDEMARVATCFFFFFFCSRGTYGEGDDT